MSRLTFVDYVLSKGGYDVQDGEEKRKQMAGYSIGSWGAVNGRVEVLLGRRDSNMTGVENEPCLTCNTLPPSKLRISQLPGLSTLLAMAP